MQIENLHDMYIAELQELASVERQMAECLSQVAARASYPGLKNTLFDHRKESEVRSQRLDTILQKHRVNPAGHIDQTMQALIYETERMLPMLKNRDLRDLGLVVKRPVRRVACGHQPIATYTKRCARHCRAFHQG